jgi:hypothetical protein
MDCAIRPSHLRRDLSTCVPVERKDKLATRLAYNSDSDNDTRVVALPHTAQNRPWIHHISFEHSNDKRPTTCEGIR